MGAPLALAVAKYSSNNVVIQFQKYAGFVIFGYMKQTWPLWEICHVDLTLTTITNTSPKY